MAEYTVNLTTEQETLLLTKYKNIDTMLSDYVNNELNIISNLQPSQGGGSFNPVIANPEDGDILTYSNGVFKNNHFFEHQNRVIVFNPSMTASEIQAVIDEVGKSLLTFGVTNPVPEITFQFEDGQYVLDKPLCFGGFMGGHVHILGNMSENRDSLRWNQAVWLDFRTSNDPSGAICIGGSTSIFNLINLKIGYNSLSDVNSSGIRANDIANVRIHGCSVGGTHNTQGHDIWMDYATWCTVSYTTLGYAENGITAKFNTKLFSWNNGNVDTQKPKYGLFASGAATIGKAGTQPLGSIANEYVLSGGEIR